MYVYFVNFMLSSFQVSVFQLLVVDRQLHLEHLHSQSCACRNVGGGCMSVECEERHVRSLCCEIRITYALVNFTCMHMYMYMYMDYIRLAYFTCKSCLMVFLQCMGFVPHEGSEGAARGSTYSMPCKNHETADLY